MNNEEILAMINALPDEKLKQFIDYLKENADSSKLPAVSPQTNH